MTAPFVDNDRFVNLGKRCASWTDARYEAFDKCGFYDAWINGNGGPDNSVEYKPTDNNYWGEKKEKLDLFARKRRSTDDCSNWDGKKKLTYLR